MGSGSNTVGAGSGKLVGLLLAGGLVVGGVIVPASSATTDSPATEQCTEEVHHYLRDEWEYAKFYLCVNKTAGMINYRVVSEETENSWGVENETRNAATEVVDVILQRDGRTVDSQRPTARASHGKLAVSGSFPVSTPGNYTIMAEPDLGIAMYRWADTNSRIFSKRLNLDVVVS